MKTDGLMHPFLLVIAAASLASCAGPARIPEIFASARPASAALLEERTLSQARELTKQQRWSEAAVQWEILQLLRPDVPEYGQQVENCQTRAKEVASLQLKAASAARERKDVDLATVSYLKALRMEPDNKIAMEGLRAIEKQRATVGPLARNARANGSVKSNPVYPPRKIQPEPYGNARQDLDLGIMLLRQGDHAGSIQAIEKYLRADPRDETARRYLGDAHLQLAQQQLRGGRKEEALVSMEKARSLKGRSAADLVESIRSLRGSLADEYYEKGTRAYYSNINEAIAQWERGLRFDPDHKLINARLKEARKAQQKIQTLDRPAAP